jgi:hypothetical protein
VLKEEAYQLLSDLVFKGFISLNITAARQTLIFKTLNDKEYQLIKLYAGLKDDPDYTNRFNTAYIVFSLLMINGENILHKREERFNELYDFFINIPRALFKKILSEIVSIRDTAVEAGGFVEGFSYTNFSRNIWRTLGNGYPNREDFTGIPGTNKLGLNAYQENWIMINRMMDEEEAYNDRFTSALLIASASNFKGARRTRALHDASRQKIKEKRKKIAQEGLIKKSNWTEQGWAAPVDTAEELVAELERQMKGYKDRHDKFIEEYMKGLEKAADDKKAESEKKLKEAQDKNKDLPMLSGSQRVLDEAEAAEMMSKKPNNLVIVPSDEVATQEQHDRFYKKIGGRVLQGK